MTGNGYVVAAVDPGERVSCVYGYAAHGGSNDFGRGEAVLAGPDHPPYDANANYVCMDHLTHPEDETTVIDHPPGDRSPRALTLAEYRALR
jgi:hypothetical protein